MPRVKKTLPEPSRQTGQRSVEPLFINRYFPQWGNPGWMAGEKWRQIVEYQPTAVACRDTLITNVATLDWAITPKDSNQLSELKSEVEYYTDLLNDSGELDYVGLTDSPKISCLRNQPEG